MTHSLFHGYLRLLKLVAGDKREAILVHDRVELELTIERSKEESNSIREKQSGIIN